MFENFISISITSFFFLYPLFFSTLTTESYEYNKTVLFLIITLFLVVNSLISFAKNKKLNIRTSTFSIPLLFLALMVTISTLFQSPNFIVATTTPIVASIFVIGFFFYLTITSSLPFEDAHQFFTPIIAAATLLSLIVVGSYIGVLDKSNFTPAGSSLSTGLFLSIVSVYLLVNLFFDLVKKKSVNLFAGKSVLFLLVSLSTLFLTYHLFTDQKPIILPFKFGWWILLNVMREPKNVFLGIGPANFVSAFTLAKSPLINATPYWNIIFTSSSSYLLNLVTETGIISLIIYITLLIQSIHRLIEVFQKKDFHTIPLTATLIYTLFILLVFPSSTVVLVTLFVLFALNAKRTIQHKISLHHLGPILWISISPFLIIIGAICFYLGRFYLAEVAFKQSLNAYVNNQGLETYNRQKDAIALNPWLDRYHSAFSNTSLTLANGLASKKDLTEDDKQNIPKLTQQAIEEAKLATRLYPTNVVNWDNLVRVYSSLINFATGADEWALESSRQRLALDPLNPQARLNLGGLYVTLKRYDEAEKLFQDAISLKPDLVNGYYNLAVVLKSEKKYSESYNAYEKAMGLVEKGSENESKIRDEMRLLPADASKSGQLKETSATLPASPIPTK